MYILDRTCQLTCILCHVCFVATVLVKKTVPYLLSNCCAFHKLEKKKKKLSQDKKQYSVVAVLDGRRTGMESGFVMKKQSLILTRRRLTYLKLN